MPTFGPATTVPMMVGMCRIVAFHHDERDESIACQSEKDRDPCEQPGNRQLANAHKSLILMWIVLFHTYSSVLVLREI